MKKLAYLADLACILIFVTIGRRAHEHGLTFKGIVSTVWPFLVGLILGWAVLKFTHRDIAERKSGFIEAMLVVAIGMLLRVVAGQGTAFTFILVALVFLNLTLVGWRVIFGRSLQIR